MKKKREFFDFKEFENIYIKKVRNQEKIHYLKARNNFNRILNFIF
jgi:hypothetical protein